MKIKALVTTIIGLILGINHQTSAQNKSKPENLVIIDVRTKGEFDGGHIKEAFLIPHDSIGGKIQHYVPDKNMSIILYCRSGSRSSIAQKTLIDLGYKNVENGGGFKDMKKRFLSE